MREVSLEEVARRVGDDAFVLVDVRTPAEYRGETAAPCDPRPGRIPGARHFDLEQLLSLPPDEIRARLGPADGVEVVSYCHSGSRSQLATEIFASLGYDAANFRGSWHEWSRDDTLPAEVG